MRKIEKNHNSHLGQSNKRRYFDKKENQNTKFKHVQSLIWNDLLHTDTDSESAAMK